MALMHSVLSLVYAFAITKAVHLLSSSTTYAFSEQFRSGYLPAGPFGILGALVYQYYALCPPLWTIGVLDAEMTDRMLVGIPMILVRGSMRTDHFFLMTACDISTAILLLLCSAWSTRIEDVFSHMAATSPCAHRRICSARLSTSYWYRFPTYACIACTVSRKSIKALRSRDHLLP